MVLLHLLDWRRGLRQDTKQEFSTFVWSEGARHDDVGPWLEFEPS
jgi:uncharacterized membrane-anchored protein